MYVESLLKKKSSVIQMYSFCSSLYNMSVLLTVQVCLDTPNLGDKTVNRISDIDVGTIPKGGQVRD